MGAVVQDDVREGAMEFPDIVQQEFGSLARRDFLGGQDEVGYLREPVNHDKNCIHGSVFW